MENELEEVTVHYKDITEECLVIYDDIIVKVKEEFKDKTGNQALVGLMMIAAIIEDGIVNVLGEEETLKIKQSILEDIH